MSGEPTPDELVQLRAQAREARAWAGRALRYLDPKYGPVDTGSAESCAAKAEAAANNLAFDLRPHNPVTPMSGGPR